MQYDPNSGQWVYPPQPMQPGAQPAAYPPPGMPVQSGGMPAGQPMPPYGAPNAAPGMPNMTQQTGQLPYIDPMQMQATQPLPVEQLQQLLAMQQYQQYQQFQQMQQLSAMPPVPPAPPTTGKQAKPPKPPKKRKRRRRRSLLSVILTLLLIVGGVTAGLIFGINALSRRAGGTAVIQSGTLGATYTGDALIVRNEVTYDDEGVAYVDYRAQEGETVQRGNVVCYVYSTGYSTKEMNALQNYRDQIKDYQQTLLKADVTNDQRMTRLETTVIERGLEVRSLVQGARGNLINQEAILADAIEERQTYFASKYSDDTRLKRLYDDEDTQQQRIDSWIRQCQSTIDGIISFYTDGFEYALTPNSYAEYSPSQVRSMIAGIRPERDVTSRGRTNIFRVVRQNNYVVLMLIQDSNWNPVEGQVYKLELEQFSNAEVEARVQSFTRASGELLVRLQVSGDVAPVLYMRTCKAELGEYVDALMVPTSALIEYEGSVGVVLPPNTFVPVNVINTRGGDAYITPVQAGVLHEGQTVQLNP